VENLCLKHELHKELSFGYCAHEELLWGELTVKQHLHMFASIWSPSWEHEKQHVARIASDMGINDDLILYTRAKNLSGGLRRRLSLAIAIIGQPDILILDEPTLCIDQFHQSRIWLTLERLKQQSGTANTSIIIKSHNADELLLACDQVGFIHNGQLKSVFQQSSIQRFREEFITMSLILVFTFPFTDTYAHHIIEGQSEYEENTLVPILQATSKAVSIPENRLDPFRITHERTKYSTFHIQEEKYVSWRLNVVYSFPSYMLHFDELPQLLDCLNGANVLEYRIGHLCPSQVLLAKC
jgi:ABC-type multidrug transport system ATPase subunit